MKLTIQYKNIDELKTYVNNAKVHSAEQIEQLKESITKFGMNDPIALWKNNEIIEGHGRLIACMELGIKKVPTIDLSFLTDKQRKKYGLVHNKLTMNTGFDYDVLVDEIESLNDIDMEMFGFEIQDNGNFELKIEQKEYSIEDFNDETFDYECPECGFKFNE